MLLPKLQGATGKYVFEVLPHTTRSGYKRLVQELDARHWKVETKCNYHRQLNGISQKPTKSEQELGTEVKEVV